MVKIINNILYICAILATLLTVSSGYGLWMYSTMNDAALSANKKQELSNFIDSSSDTEKLREIARAYIETESDFSSYLNSSVESLILISATIAVFIFLLTYEALKLRRLVSNKSLNTDAPR